MKISNLFSTVSRKAAQVTGSWQASAYLTCFHLVPDLIIDTFSRDIP